MFNRRNFFARAAPAAPYPLVLATHRNLFQLQEEYVTALMTAWRSAVEIEGLLVME